MSEEHVTQQQQEQQRPLQYMAPAPAKGAHMPWWGALGWVFAGISVLGFLVGGGDDGMSVGAVLWICGATALGIAGLIVKAIREPRP